MGGVGRCKNPQFLSACYLMTSTFLLMIVVFSVEDVLFPSKCNSCESQSDQVELDKSIIGRTRPVVQNSSADESGQQDLGAANHSSDIVPDTTSEVSAEETEQKDRNVAVVSEEDVTEKAGTGIAKPKVPPKVDSGGEGNATAPSRPVVVRSVQFYTKVYKHPVVKLRKLTLGDGAPRIQSNISPPDREISIVTQTSADRLLALESTCLTWGGALVIAMHVRLQSEIASVYEQVKQMHARVEVQSGCRLDIQLVTEDGFETEEDALRALYPVNALRNVALGMATTKLVFLLDADFKPSPRLHEILTEDEEKYQDLLRQATEERQLFVVPAFEALDVNGRRTKVPVTVPETMEDLRERWEQKTIDCFHCLKSPTGHMPTNFKKFFNTKTTDPYPISYRGGFEPYIIGALDAIPRYDARFRGYGENKVSHIYSCAADGMGFQVLPNVFVFELPHPPSEAHNSYIGKHKNPDQRYQIIGLYRQFKHEIAKIQTKKDADRYRHFLHTAAGKLDEKPS